MKASPLNRFVGWFAGCAFCLFVLVIPSIGGAKTQFSMRTADALHEVIEKTYYVNRDGSYTLKVHLRTKVLTYKGKVDHADFRYPYNSSYQSVSVLKAHTLTPDGRVVPIDSREIHDINDPQDTRATIYSRQRLKVISFPSVEPGATVEINLEIHSQRGFWATECFRLGDPVKRKIVTVSLPKELPLRVKLPSIHIQETKNHAEGRLIYRWEARNIPERISEPMLPPIENRQTCLFLSTFTSWKGVARFFGKILSEPLLKGNLTKFKGNTPDDLYVDFMKRFIIYPLNFFHTALTFQAPETTLKKGYGSPVDLAILFYGLLQERGYVPKFLMMNSGSMMLGEFRNMPMPSLFDDVIVRCKGRDYAFYAKDLPPGFTGQQGKLELDLKTGSLAPSCQRYSNRSILNLSIVPTASFTIEGMFMMKSEGMQAVSVRDWLRYKTRDEWRIAASQVLHDIDPLARPNGRIVKRGLDVLTAPVVLEGNFIIPCQFSANGRLSFVTIKRPDLPRGLETCLEARKGPLMIERDFTNVFEQRITLSRGVHVSHCPPSERGSLKMMDWEFSVSMRKRELTIRRIIHLKRCILFPGTVAYFRFIKAVNDLYSPANRLIVIEGLNGNL